MRVLMLTPRLPFPPTRGDALIALERLRRLGLEHEIDLVSFVGSEDEAAAAEALAPYVRSVRSIALPRSRGALNALAGAPFSRDPLQVLFFRSRSFTREVAARAAQADVVHAFFHRTAPYAFETRLPVVLELMDSLTLRLEHYVEVSQPPQRWLYREELRRMRRYEPAIARRADHVIVVSERDRERLPCDHVTVIENGVDTDVFFPVPERRRANALVFSGNMGYEPNVDAAVWLVERCLPLVRARIPDVSLDIVGARPARAVRRLASRGATVTGPVDSMPAALNEASVAVVPLRSGSGIQNKILEAMACGLPVVTTSVGLGTIDATPGVELLVADGEAEFAEAIVRLLRDPTLRAELGRRARERVVAGYSWDRGAELVEQIYRDVVDKR